MNSNFVPLLSDEEFENMLLQKHPMRLVDNIISCDFPEYNGVCVLEVGKRYMVPLDANGDLPVCSLIEVMAQSICAISVYVKKMLNETVADIGLLLGLRGCKFHVPGVIKKGSIILIDVEEFFNDNQYKIMNVKAKIEEKLIAEAKITVFMPTVEQAQQVFKGAFNGL